MTQRSDPNETSATAGLPLFDTPARHLSGKTDPPTSREAAGRMAKSGALGSDQRLALAMIRDFPGRTTKEHARRIVETCRSGDGEEVRQRIGRRLNELEKAGLVRRDGVRDGCSVWWPTDKRED